MAGCAPATLEQALDGADLTRDSLVRLADSSAVAARRSDGSVQIIGFDLSENGDWVTSVRGSGSPAPASGSAHLISTAGETDAEWNSYFFGTAPEFVSRVSVEGLEGAGGQVVGGAWVLAFREKDLVPTELRWQFLDARGRVVDSGTGLFPPSS